MRRSLPLLCLCLAALRAPGADLKLGLIGLDTSHVIEFTRRFNQFGGISSNLLIAGLMFTDRALKTKIFTKQTTVHK